MNCDQVFDVLTRGPFPTGSDIDQPVERHLAVCHDCRRLAEALRPAVELFHEALSVEESGSLPAYQSAEVGADAVQLSVLIDEALATPLGEAAPRTVEKSARRRRLWPRFAAAAMLGAALAMTMHLATLSWRPAVEAASSESGGSAIGAVVSPYHPDLAGQRWLAALKLPQACFERPHNASAPTADADPTEGDFPLACCTHCHAADSAVGTPPKAVATVQRACAVCHVN